MRQYASKEEWIRQYVTNKHVLDVGCVDHRLDRTDRPWLHGFICEHARKVVGVDLLEDEARQLRARGYDVLVADAESLCLNDQFEVVVAGDIIEHVSNPGRFLTSAGHNLIRGGHLLVTTPNPITLRRILQVAIRGNCVPNSQHTCWFTAPVLGEAASRCGYKVVEEAYVDDVHYNYQMSRRLEVGRGASVKMTSILKGFVWKSVLFLNSFLCRCRPRLSETLCLALEKT